MAGCTRVRITNRVLAAAAQEQMRRVSINLEIHLKAGAYYRSRTTRGSSFCRLIKQMLPSLPCVYRFDPARSVSIHRFFRFPVFSKVAKRHVYIYIHSLGRYRQISLHIRNVREDTYIYTRIFTARSVRFLSIFRIKLYDEIFVKIRAYIYIYIHPFGR